ncbi:MAG: porphobilinogen synthase, partial [Actinomycetota bacterium]|nr:porphobilinogen synthase [Actinomycetota bacterium]
MGSFPDHRPRRLRRTAGLRRAFAETSVTPGDLIAPLFVKEGIADPAAIPSMPGHFQHTLDSVVKEAREIAERGIAGLLLFGIPARKDPKGNEAWARDGIS